MPLCLANHEVKMKKPFHSIASIDAIMMDTMLRKDAPIKHEIDHLQKTHNKLTRSLDTDETANVFTFVLNIPTRLTSHRCPPSNPYIFGLVKAICIFTWRHDDLPPGAAQ